MSRIYFYKMTADNGGAPHVRDGLLSLAICKPRLRSTALCGDLIFGFAADKLRDDNALIYAAVITKVSIGGKYYTNAEFAGRGDRIYKKMGREFVLRENARYHTADQRGRDIGSCPAYERACVLLSTDYRYFGSRASAMDRSKSPEIMRALTSLSQGHRVHHEFQLRIELEELKKRIWSEPVTNDPRPTSPPEADDCCEGPSGEIGESDDDLQDGSATKQKRRKLRFRC